MKLILNRNARRNLGILTITVLGKLIYKLPGKNTLNASKKLVDNEQHVDP